MSQSVLIVGATSDIGRAVAQRYAQEGWEVGLTVRNPADGAREAADLETRTGVRPYVACLDLLETELFDGFAGGLPRLPDTVISVAGELGEQRLSETDLGHARTVFRVNFEGPALLLGVFAERFVLRGSGTLIGISSVAGERGRASNYTYGAAKAGFSAYLSGLRARLAKPGIRVVAVKPGFVRTRMTAGMKLPPLLTAEPQEVADAIFRRGQNGRADVIFVRRIWALVMLIIRVIPEPIFKRLPL